MQKLLYWVIAVWCTTRSAPRSIILKINDWVKACCRRLCQLRQTRSKNIIRGVHKVCKMRFARCVLPKCQWLTTSWLRCSMQINAKYGERGDATKLFHLILVMGIAGRIFEKLPHFPSGEGLIKFSRQQIFIDFWKPGGPWSRRSYFILFDDLYLMRRAFPFFFLFHFSFMTLVSG